MCSANISMHYEFLMQCPYNVHKLDGYMCDSGQVICLSVFSSVCVSVTIHVSLHNIQQCILFPVEHMQTYLLSN